ncbi:MAG TPA: cupin domain-containing protein [Elusimicrobia bacterium]|nr:MAG: cupin [Elusimicrobia bacterium GWA2_66_18]OGR73789.1 MAG: cupin [Elusimicrobia bacterium GWC2_65_9]HAZ07477.1 cupin domain-containing protein [Elusimicrobiota bacterium]
MSDSPEELRGRPLVAADLVAYDAGAVVSRAIVKKPVGTVTLFSFDKGEGLSEHTAPFDALAHILDGAAEVVVDGTPHRVAAGQLIVMPAGKPHALNAVERFKMMLVMIRA